MEAMRLKTRWSSVKCAKCDAQLLVVAMGQWIAANCPDCGTVYKIPPPPGLRKDADTATI